MNLTKDDIKRVSALLKKYKEIRAAYLFGSAAKNKLGKLSDIDIAIYLDNKLTKKKMFDIHLNIIAKLCSILKTDKIDIVIMNEANTSLNYNIIASGILLKNTREKADIEYKTLSDYLDRKHYEDLSADIFLKRAAEKGLR